MWRWTPRGPRLKPGFEMVNDYDGEHFRKDLPNDSVRLVLAEDNPIPEPTEGRNRDE
jgi:hypothetical protein